LLLGAIAVSAGTVPKHIDTLEQEGIVPTKRAVVPASSTARLNEKKRPTAAKTSQPKPLHSATAKGPDSAGVPKNTPLAAQKPFPKSSAGAGKSAPQPGGQK
jgi:hypothetical protein